ncbi:MAG TPA: 6-carboxytetrahydropterin synthase QueD [bacterium]|nr:6-carboxytetrahydropterin synthase QueD [bacterium]
MRKTRGPDPIYGESEMYEVSKETTFSSAHSLREYEGRCEALHGHNWKVKAHVAATELDRLGMVVDFKILKAALEETADRLDHTLINDVPPFDSINPSAENLAKHFYAELSARLNDGRARVSRVDVWESEGSRASYFE